MRLIYPKKKCIKKHNSWGPKYFALWHALNSYCETFEQSISFLSSLCSSSVLNTMAGNNNANPAEAVAVTVIEENVKKPKKAQDTKKNILPVPGKFVRVKHISGILSVVSFVFSLPILASVTWLLYMKSYDCEWLFKLPRLQIGISIGLICVFLICNGTLFLRTRLPMVGIIVVLVPLIVMFTVGLALIGANNMENRRIPATPLWFKMKMHDNSLWSNIKDCIYDTGVCQDLATTSMQLKSYDFSMKKLSSIEVSSILHIKLIKLAGIIFVLCDKY